MTWLALLKLVLQFATLIAQQIQQKALLDAGEARAILTILEDADARLDKARTARNASSGVSNGLDPNNRDNWPKDNHGGS